MRICLDHWGLLKKAMEDRGLMKFVSNSGQVVVEKLQSELAGAPKIETWDPLMAANLAIWNNALEMGGLYLMGTDENGSEYCPICESVKNEGPAVEWWITSAADEQLGRAKELGVIKELPVQ
jgi:hypothetical protein